MKKFGLLCLAIVLALGALGVGYASWTDTIFIEGTVETGEVCIEFDTSKAMGEVICTNPPAGAFDPYPDFNWSGWSASDDPNKRSCPPGYEFDLIECVDKDVASVTFVRKDADGNVVDPADYGIIPIKELEVTIHDAYPHLAVDFSFWVHNCGSIPVILQEPVITQSDFLLIEYGDNIGTQLHPCNSVEISFVVGVVQHKGYYGYGGAWIVDDESQDLLPQNNDTDITFTIEIPAKQWAECTTTPG
jgi:hypothetical protein